MAHGPRSTAVAYPLQTIDRDQAPHSGFFLTTEFANLGERMPNRANNPPNVTMLPGSIASIYVGKGTVRFMRSGGKVYRSIPTPASATGRK